jgi:hypothetical protein
VADEARPTPTKILIRTLEPDGVEQAHGPDLLYLLTDEWISAM